VIKIVIIEEQRLFLESLIELLNKQPIIEIIGTASSHEKGVLEARTKSPSVVLLDINMSSIGGLEIIKRITRCDSNTKVLIISSSYKHPFPYRALQSGAMGFVTKKSTFDDLINAIKIVNRGEKYISPEVAHHLAINSISDVNDDEPSFNLLSARELQVMIMITSGLKVQNISEKLCLSPKTVNSYRYRLFEKLNIKNDVELTHLAIGMGLIEIANDSHARTSTEEKINLA
jgi:two-component system invasion response regulator UvrY